MNSKFVDDDEYKTDEKRPYITVVITKEQFDRLPKNLTCHWYVADGIKLFKVKDINGNWTDQMMAFLVLTDGESK